MNGNGGPRLILTSILLSLLVLSGTGYAKQFTAVSWNLESGGSNCTGHPSKGNGHPLKGLTYLHLYQVFSKSLKFTRQTRIRFGTSSQTIYRLIEASSIAVRSSAEVGRR